MREIFSFLFCCTFFLATAQYTAIINSSRPGLSETPYSIGSGVYQLETGYQFSGINSTKYETLSYNHKLNQFIRIGSDNERIEYQVLLEQIQNDVSHTANNYKTGDFAANVGVGFKYFIFERKIEDTPEEIISWKRRNAFDYGVFIPSVAVSAVYGMRVNPNKTKEDTISEIGLPIATQLNSKSFFKLNALLQNSFSNRFATVINLGVENRTYNKNIAATSFNIILSGSYYLGYKWSVFGEFNSKMNGDQKLANLNTGCIYFINKNSQLDFSVNAFPGSNYNRFGAAIGYSYRIDHHYNRLVRKEREKSLNTKIFDNNSKFVKFFKNLAIDFSIFTKNLFRKKGNKLPKRKEQNNDDEIVPAPPILK